jgi:hypothetical protein
MPRSPEKFPYCAKWNSQPHAATGIPTTTAEVGIGDRSPQYPLQCDEAGEDKYDDSDEGGGSVNVAHGVQPLSGAGFNHSESCSPWAGSAGIMILALALEHRVPG